MLHRWLEQPYVREWWGDPDHEIVLIEEEVDGGPTDMRVVWADVPFAFVQDYPVHYWPTPQFADLAEGTRAVDMFLGDAAYLGQCHAKAFMRVRAEQLLEAGAKTVVIDPDVANTRAIATYRGAGFKAVSERDCEDGSRVLVMEFGGADAH